MPFEYVNRRGERYYLLQGKTKTGKAKYYVSRKPDGVRVDAVPEGYEIHENPEHGIVSVRKLRPTRPGKKGTGSESSRCLSPFFPEERAKLERWTRELTAIKYFIIDLDADSMVIYAPNTDPDAAVGLLNKLFGGFPDAPEEIARRTHYTAMLRFTLTDDKRRLYTLERWCFRGSIDDWLFLAAGKPLEALARKYLPHLGRESFFELI